MAILLLDSLDTLDTSFHRLFIIATHIESLWKLPFKLSKVSRRSSPPTGTFGSPSEPNYRENVPLLCHRRKAANLNHYISIGYQCTRICYRSRCVPEREVKTRLRRRSIGRGRKANPKVRQSHVAFQSPYQRRHDCRVGTCKRRSWLRVALFLPSLHFGFDLVLVCGQVAAYQLPDPLGYVVVVQVAENGEFLIHPVGYSYLSALLFFTHCIDIL